MIMHRDNMRMLGTLLGRIARDRRGVTAMEYGLLTGLIALVIAASLSLFSTNANHLFSHIATTI